MPVTDAPVQTTQVALLQRILSTSRVFTASGEAVELHSQASAETGARLQRIIRDIRAVKTLEIGLAFGVSALFICEALAALGDSSARHIAIDPFQHDEYWRGIGLSNIREAGFESLLDFRELPSHQAISDIEREGATIDLAFVDGMHTFDYTMLDLFLVDRILRIGGVVIVDDSEWPGVRKAIRYFVTNRGYRVLECWGEPDAALPTSSRQRRLRSFAATAVRWISPLGRIARPELVMSDRSLGLVPETRCIALTKTIDDDLRGYFGHHEF